MTNIREEIVRHRRARIAGEGHTLGVRVPPDRTVPVVPFLRAPRLICEVKRRSPSRGDIDAGLDPVELAGSYTANGARSISVLTEEDHFRGSLADLMAIKNAHPDCAVLRKDFLVDRTDIEVSYRAGADAVLLIASILSADQLGLLLEATAEYGMTALVEVHDSHDIARVKRFQPRLVGINARNLATFNVDLLAPLALNDQIDWEHQVVFESGISTREDSRLVALSGFDGVLVGEAVVRDPSRIAELTLGLCEPRNGPRTVHPSGDFWARLVARRAAHPGTVSRPLVKICGITNREDAEAAVALGADVLGFVLAQSPRRTTPDFVRSLADLDVLKAAVVVTGGSHGTLPDDVRSLLTTGAVDVVQFHGDETPRECAAEAYPYYRALRPSAPEDASEIQAYGCPRVLVDARSDHAYGGTGKRMSADVVRAAAASGPLWLAGGLTDENIAGVVRETSPELVDVSSGLERSPGKKVHERLERLFKELNNV